MTFVRAVSIALSLLMHGGLAYATWLWLLADRWVILDPGPDFEIALEPSAMNLSQTARPADSAESVTGAEVAQHADEPPAPAAPAIPEMVEETGVVPSTRPAKPEAHRLAEAVETVPAPTNPAALTPAPEPPIIGAQTAAGQLPALPIQEELALDAEHAPAAEAERPDELAGQDPGLKARVPAAPDAITLQTPAEMQRAPPDTIAPASTLPAIAQERPPQLTQLEQPDTAPTEHATPDAIADATTMDSAASASPLDVVEDVIPEVISVVAYPRIVAVATEQGAGKQAEGSADRSVSAYLSKVNGAVQRSKVNPRSRSTGTVVMKFTVATDGSLLSKEVAVSSGHGILDKAAAQTLERAAPFPPIPQDVSTTPMTFTQAFRFVLR